VNFFFRTSCKCPLGSIVQTLSTHKVYKGSGLARIEETVHDLIQACDEYIGRHFIFMWGRFIVILSLLALASKRCRGIRLFVLSISMLEVTAEYIVYHLFEIGIFNGRECKSYIAALRCVDVPTYMLSMVLSFFKGTVIGIGETNSAQLGSDVHTNGVITAANTPVTKSDIDGVIQTMQKQMTAEKEAHNREREEFREQFFSLQRQLTSSFSAAAASHVNELYHERNHKMHSHSDNHDQVRLSGLPLKSNALGKGRLIVTPSLKQNNGRRANDNRNGAIIGMQQAESPVMSPRIPHDRIALMKSTVKRPRHKRKRRDDGDYDNDDGADDSSNFDSNSEESLVEVHSKKLRGEEST